MRKSIIAGLTFFAALAALAGQSYAYTGQLTADHPMIELASLKDSKPAKPARHVRKPLNRAVAETQKPETFRIPANPVIRDCVHIFFPQCTRSGLNDGTYGFPY